MVALIYHGLVSLAKGLRTASPGRAALGTFLVGLGLIRRPAIRGGKLGLVALAVALARSSAGKGIVAALRESRGRDSEPLVTYEVAPGETLRLGVRRRGAAEPAAV